MRPWRPIAFQCSCSPVAVLQDCATSPSLGDAKIWTWDHNTCSLALNPLSYHISTELPHLHWAEPGTTTLAVWRSIHWATTSPLSYHIFTELPHFRKWTTFFHGKMLLQLFKIKTVFLKEKLFSFLIWAFWRHLSRRQACFFVISVKFLIFDTLCDLFQDNKFSPPRREIFLMFWNRNQFLQKKTAQNKKNTFSKLVFGIYSSLNNAQRHVNCEERCTLLYRQPTSGFLHILLTGFSLSWRPRPDVYSHE